MKKIKLVKPRKKTQEQVKLYVGETNNYKCSN